MHEGPATSALLTTDNFEIAHHQHEAGYIINDSKYKFLFVIILAKRWITGPPPARFGIFCQQKKIMQIILDTVAAVIYIIKMDWPPSALSRIFINGNNYSIITSDNTIINVIIGIR